VLSDQERIYVKSQTKEDVPKGYNTSEYRRRIRGKVKLTFVDFHDIINSKVLPQSYKDKVFDFDIISSFLGPLVYYSAENANVEEAKKQEIANQLISIGVAYFRQRYPSTFIISEVNEAMRLLTEVVELSKQKAADERALDFYKMRSRMTIPPLLKPDPIAWHALCVICWQYSRGDSKKEAVSLLRHAKRCSFDKNIERCVKFVPPKKSSMRH